MKDLDINFPLDKFEKLIIDIASSHLPKVVLPVPGRAEIPIIFLSKEL